MKTTKHTKKRMQQRGIPSSAVDLIRAFGTPENRPGQAMRYRFSKQSYRDAEGYLKSMIQFLDKMKDRCLVVDESSETVITAY